MSKDKSFVERSLDTLVQDCCNNIRKIRNRRGYTQEKLGEISGLGRIRIVEIENGRYEPKLSTLNVIALALGVKVYQLLMHDATELE